MREKGEGEVVLTMKFMIYFPRIFVTQLRKEEGREVERSFLKEDFITSLFVSAKCRRTSFLMKEKCAFFFFK